MSTIRYIKIADGPLDIFDESIHVTDEIYNEFDFELAGTCLVKDSNSNRSKHYYNLYKREKVPVGTVIGSNGAEHIEIVSGDCWYVSNDSKSISQAVLFIFDNVTLLINGVTIGPKTGIYGADIDGIEEICYYQKEILHTIPSKYTEAVSYKNQNLSKYEQTQARINQGLYAENETKSTITWDGDTSNTESIVISFDVD